MKAKEYLGVLLLAAFLLAGCQQEVVEEEAPESLLAEEIQGETLYLRADGTVQFAYVEEFGEDYYKEEELRSFMDEMLDVYNEAHGANMVALAQVRASDGKACAVLTYQDIAAYADFKAEEKDTTERFAERITAKDAEARYSGQTFTDVKKKTEKAGGEVFGSEEQSIVVIHESMEVRTAGNVLYLAGGNLLDNRTVEVPEGTEAVIVYKN